MPDLTWEEPPAQHDESLIALRTALTQRPNQWAKVKEGLPRSEAMAYVDKLRTRGISPSRRVQADGTYHVYAKWVE